MVACEFPKSLPKVRVRSGAETSTFHTDALGEHDARIVKRNITVVIG
jgi:hypothetical protein